MPIPIGTIRNASTPGDDIVQAVRRVLPPAGQRAEAIQKLLDMLGRHLSGKEVLPRDALVRLIEDLARVLKFPPLPQETGRAFVRRLVEVVEALPLPERLAIERQLGGGRPRATAGSPDAKRAIGRVWEPHDALAHRRNSKPAASAADAPASRCSADAPAERPGAAAGDAEKDLRRR
ncbi:hypothetical protein [Sinorhizobium fredii]|uniref:hypothetical protein n=1 Tax=Rhizobium fredii TaxID=380 RepID=UPI003518E2DE